MLPSHLFSEDKKVDPGITWDVGRGEGVRWSGSRVCPAMYSLLAFSPFLTKPPFGSGCTPPASEPAGAGLPVPLPGARYIPLVTDMLHLLFLKDVQLPLCLNTNKSRKQHTRITQVWLQTFLRGGSESKNKPEPVNQQCWASQESNCTNSVKKTPFSTAWSEATGQGGKAGWLKSFGKGSPNKTSRKALKSHLWNDFSCLSGDEVCLLILLH